MTKDLKLCPLCGTHLNPGQWVVVEGNIKSVGCPRCGAITQGYASTENAVSAWEIRGSISRGNDDLRSLEPIPVQFIPDTAEQSLRDEVAMRCFVSIMEHNTSGEYAPRMSADQAFKEADAFMAARAEDIERRSELNRHSDSDTNTKSGENKKCDD